MTNNNTIPSDFIWRRLHSIAGFWLVLYLIEHLLVNSQAALFVGNDGRGFIHSVNAIHDLPYLPIIEILALGVPILIHLIWGIRYAWTAKMNSFGDTGHTPYLPEYSRNRAYTWQRITSYLLVIGIIAHVIHMRVIEYPEVVKEGGTSYYAVKVTEDPGLLPLGNRLNYELLDPTQIDILASNERVVVARDFGTAELVMVRNTFKNPWMLALYTLFVLTACFHAFNGLWTFLIKWGVTLTVRSQKIMLKVCTFLMCLVTFLGLAAIWGTYWINLRQ